MKTLDLFIRGTLAVLIQLAIIWLTWAGSDYLAPFLGLATWQVFIPATFICSLAMFLLMCGTYRGSRLSQIDKKKEESDRVARFKSRVDARMPLYGGKKR